MSPRRLRQRVNRIDYGTVVAGGDANRQGPDMALLACGHAVRMPSNVFRTPSHMRCQACERQRP